MKKHNWWDIEPGDFVESDNSLYLIMKIQEFNTTRGFWFLDISSNAPDYIYCNYFSGITDGKFASYETYIERPSIHYIKMVEAVFERGIVDYWSNF